MQIDWQRAINDILSNKLSCPRCGSLIDEAFVGYLRLPEASDWAPLCEGCTKQRELRRPQVRPSLRVVRHLGPAPRAPC